MIDGWIAFAILLVWIPYLLSRRRREVETVYTIEIIPFEGSPFTQHPKYPTVPRPLDLDDWR